MKPLIILIVVFTVCLLILKILFHKYEIPPSGRIAMSAMLIFTAIGHFAFTKGMAMMIPDFIHFKTELVFITGVIEIAAAIGLLIPPLQNITGILLIAFFALLLPANINAAIHHVDYQKGTYAGNGLSYLWFRIPLQILFIVWTYMCCISSIFK